MTPGAARRAAAAACLVLASCGGGAGRDAGAPADSVAAVTGAGPAWRGVYSRDRDAHGFRLCGDRFILPVETSPSLLASLDAKVDFQAPRPTTTVFVQLRGDTARAPGGNFLFRVTAVDSSRALRPGECAAARAPSPPAPPAAEVAAAIRAALGPDSALARGARAEAVWLNGDELGDLLVLVRAPAACNPGGCTLLALEAASTGYRLVGRTTSVRAPVEVRPELTDGWNDVTVRVGQGVYGDRLVVLRYGARGYPSDAALQPDARPSEAPGRLVFRP